MLCYWKQIKPKNSKLDDRFVVNIDAAEAKAFHSIAQYFRLLIQT